MTRIWVQGEEPRWWQFILRYRQRRWLTRRDPSEPLVSSIQAGLDMLPSLMLLPDRFEFKLSPGLHLPPRTEEVGK